MCEELVIQTKGT